MRFDGKNVLVAGGSSGIGLAVVQQLHREKSTVFVLSRTASAEWPENIRHLSIDLTGDTSGVPAFLPEKLDGLVYCPGSITLKPFGRLTQDDFLRDFQINVLGAAGIIQHSLKNLKNAADASIVLISSVAAATGMPYHTSIAAAKGALESMALTLAAELAFQKIRVNVVAPSLTDTPLAAALLNTAEKAGASAGRHPLGRIGQPGDISNMISFLLSDESSWMTGQIIGIDGGLGRLRTN